MAVNTVAALKTIETDARTGSPLIEEMEKFMQNEDH